MLLLLAALLAFLQQYRPVSGRNNQCLPASHCSPRMPPLHGCLQALAAEDSAAPSLVFAVTRADADTYTKRVALQSWSLGYTLTDTIIAATPTALHIITNAKKAAFLASLKVRSAGPAEQPPRPVPHALTHSRIHSRAQHCIRRNYSCHNYLV